MTETRLHRLTYAALLVLAAGLFMTPVAAAAAHVLLLVPGAWFAADFLKRRDFNLPARFWGLAAVWAAGVLSVAFNLDVVERPAANAFKTKYYLIGLLSFFSLRRCAKDYLDVPKIRLVANLALVSTALASLMGAVGLFTGYNPLKMRQACDFARSCGMSSVVTYANGLALFLVVLAGALVHRRRLAGYFDRRLAWTSLTINLAGLYLSHTKGAWLGLLAAIPFFFKRGGKKFFLAGFGGVVVLVAAVLAGPRAEETMSRIKRAGLTNHRISFYQMGWRAFLERPVFGWGYRNIYAHSTDIKKKNGIAFADSPGDAHNNFLQFFASAGVFGGLAFLFFLLSWMIHSFKRRDVIGDLVFPMTICFMVSGMAHIAADGEIKTFVLLFWAL